MTTMSPGRDAAKLPYPAIPAATRNATLPASANRTPQNRDVRNTVRIVWDMALVTDYWVITISPVVHKAAPLRFRLFVLEPLFERECVSFIRAYTTAPESNASLIHSKFLGLSPSSGNMVRRTIQALASILLGAVTLYAGWGNALPLLTPEDELCLLQGPPPGLHLNEAGMIVYTECQYQYEYAWPVFLFLSLIGIALLVNGARLYRKSSAERVTPSVSR